MKKVVNILRTKSEHWVGDGFPVRTLFSYNDDPTEISPFLLFDYDGDAKLLVLTGQPIDEPVVGYGPFVMNSETEIRKAISDFNSGRFGQATSQ